MHDIFHIFSAKKTVREPLISQYINDILTAFMLEKPSENMMPAYTGIAEKIIAYINSHFSEDIQVEHLAVRAGLSQYHFIRIFKNETGITPHRYLTEVRMNAAKYLLINSRLSVKDICYQTGFSSESVFCSAFKKSQGLTPSQYRTNSQQL